MAIYAKRRRRGVNMSRWKPYGIVMLILTTFLYGGYKLFSSDLLKVKNVTVTGIAELSREEVTEKVRETALLTATQGFFGTEYLFMWPDTVKLPEEPLVKSIMIDRDWFSRTVNIKVEERRRLGIWCFENGCRWFSDDGLVLDPAPETEGGLILEIHDPGTTAPKLQEPVIANEQFKNLVDIIDKLTNRSIATSDMTVKRERQEFIVNVSDGPELMFSLRFVPSDEMMKFIDAEREAKHLNKLAYIDFTVERRIYTRER